MPLRDSRDSLAFASESKERFKDKILAMSLSMIKCRILL